ncbi:hypothetical protein TNCV_4779401 [Trichonephila clavipes]|nr:hypothetical protein TNCV_4779401 [Trichonephila clavipes]
MIGIVFKASADIGEKFAKLCNPADCHPSVSFPSPLLKKCSLFNDFRVRHPVRRKIVYWGSFAFPLLMRLPYGGFGPCFTVDGWGGRSEPTPVNRLVVPLFGVPEETLL